MKNPLNRGDYNISELKNMAFKHIGSNISIAKNSTLIGLTNISIEDSAKIDDNVALYVLSGLLSPERT